MTKKYKFPAIAPLSNYFFCNSTDCPVVYFNKQ
ncbi:hypothetical protein, partial [Fischerella thermalis]